MACTWNLLNYYRETIDRNDMFLRYVYKLHDVLIDANYWIEAGCVLRLHADSLGTVVH